MSGSPGKLSLKLQAEGEKAVAFFNNLSSQELELGIYSDGPAWNARELLAHFVSAETAFHELIEDILAGGNGAPEGFDIDVFNQRQVLLLGDIPASELIEQFQQVRRQTVQMVEKLDPELLDRTARHPFLGIAPLIEIIKLIFRHNQIHLRDIRSAISVEQ